MIAFPKQGTEQWKQQRRGIPTASRFKDIVVFDKRKKAWRAGTGKAYLYELVADAFANDPKFGGNEHTERGNELEPKARACYELSTGLEVQEAGFMLSSCLRFGASPDGLIGDSGGCEFKCPDAKKHVEYLIGDVVPSEYKPQVYGSMVALGLDWWDFSSYHPNMKPLIVRTTVDSDDFKEFVDVFHPAMDEFLKALDEMKSLVSVEEVLDD